MFAGAQAYASEISNVASVTWTNGALTTTVPSNAVVITVNDTPPQPVAINFFQLTSPNIGTATPLPATQCSSNGGMVDIEFTGAFAGTSTSPAFLAETTAIHAGQPLVLSIANAAANTNANAIDTLQIVLEGTTSAADRETLVLKETGANTGEFMGYINTRAMPPAPVNGDCVLSVQKNDDLRVVVNNASGTVIGNGSVDILVDPFGIVFDSADGRPVDGATVTLIDNSTGQPAQVFGDDGVSTFPNQLVTGSTVTDSSGLVYDFTDGFYRFPFVRPGDYRIVVSPPGDYRWSSDADPTYLRSLTRPDGEAMEIIPASFGQVLTLASPEAVRVDIPVDRPSTGLVLAKRAHVASASPGDFVRYEITVSGAGGNPTGSITITDDLPIEMRLRADSVTYNGNPIVANIAPDGRRFSITAPALGGGQSGTLAYITEVRPDARNGVAVNRASATDSRGGNSGTVDAPVRIVKDPLTDRYTIIGRVTEGGCITDPKLARGIGGVRVMLEDGTYTVTDADGRYHFEGVRPGKHVVQIDPNSLPLDQEALNCPTNNRAAQSPISRFVEGDGGALKRADFHARTVAPRTLEGAKTFTIPEAISDSEAAGADTDWLTGQTVGTAFLYPLTDHNPRLRSTRVAIKHPTGKKVALSINGTPVPPMTFDGVRTNGDRSLQVSLWRGIPLEIGANILVARVLNDDGTLHQELTQTVHLSGAPMQAKLIPELGTYVADGITRPVIAVRLTDRYGRPISHNTNGRFSVPQPYQAAIEVDAEQARQLAGMDRAPTGWQVVGDDGIAYIQLEPTTASGSVQITFSFADGEVKREQTLDVWLDAGNRPWTVVALASVSYGFNKLNHDLTDPAMKKRALDGRLAFYAKGKVSDKWLLTVAYDSDKDHEETRFAGTVDPRAYYTIYADRAEQRYDAASLRKLYAKLERPNFYAMFGDYQTNINDPQLTRYQRSLNGFKAQYGTPKWAATLFYSETAQRYKRSEIQGNGLTGPYPLNARFIIPNSETITLQVRDRLRSDIIVSEQRLSRYIDYDIDYRTGTIRFKNPILSRDFDGNPQFIIADYEVEGVGQRVTNAGGRVSYTTSDEKLRVGVTAIHDESDTAKTEMLGGDVRYRPNNATEVRAEYAYSKGEAMRGQSGPGAEGDAWLVEAEHHSKDYDLLAYARQQDGSFGVGQTNASESATRKIGMDARTKISRSVSLGALAWQENQLGSGARRRAASAEFQLRDEQKSATLGVVFADDQLSDGTSNRSTLVRFTGSQKIGRKLTIDAGAELPIDGKNASADFPTRYLLGARYTLNHAVQLVAGYEHASGGAVKADTFRAGFDVTPWEGGRVLATAGQQTITEYGPRSFAAYGLKQSFQLSEKFTVDLSVDGNRTLGGIRRDDVINPNQPVATGGFLSSDGNLTEDFIAVSMGTNYLNGPWSMTGRIEYRDADSGVRYGGTAGFIRQIGEGEAIGGLIQYTHANNNADASSEVAELQLSWAHRPADSEISWLTKVELRHDEVKGAVEGTAAPVTGSYIINGDARSRRAIGMITINYTPIGQYDDQGKQKAFYESGEYSFFWGTRYVSERFGTADVDGWSNVFGLDARFDVSKRLDIGFMGTLRAGNNFDSLAYSGGPMVTFAPDKNMNVRLGYNVLGFEDRDFEESRYTRDGPYIQLDLKLDQTTFKDLGL